MNGRRKARASLRTLTIAAAAITLAPSLYADGTMLPEEALYRKHRQNALINEPEQKAVIYYRNGIEDLIISPRFEGPASRFAWVIPVPSRPKVDKLDGAIFHELERLTAPADRPRGGTFGGAPTKGVDVLERRTVGAYDVAVLQAGQSDALVQWLRENGFALVPEVEGPMRAYVQERWTFVAMRVNVPDAAEGLRTGALAPIRLTFRSARCIYPLRVSSANPKPFAVTVFVVTPLDPDADPVGLRTIPHGLATSWVGRALWVGEPARSYAPTLARLAPGRVAVYLFHWNYRPEQCSGDLVFTPTPLTPDRR